MMPDCRASRRGETPESGNITILSIALCVVVLALILVFGSIAQMQIERKRLLALADATAAHAADALDEEAYFLDPGPDIVLTDASVRAAAGDYLALLPADVTGRFSHLRLAAPTGAVASRTAEVSLSARVRPALIPWAIVPFADGFTLTVTSAAQAD